MRHKGTRLCHIIDDFIGEQVRLDGRDTVTLDAFHPVERFHQIEERLSGGLAKVADVHPRNDNLLASFFSCLTGLCHNVLDTSVTATSAGKRDGAIGTEVIATILHLQEITGTVAP